MTKQNSNILVETQALESKDSAGSTVRLRNRRSDLAPKATLGELLYQQLILQNQMVEAGGEITDNEDIIWRNQEIAIKDKVDAYGYVLSELDAELKKLSEIKREASARIQKAIDRAENDTARLKQRLNYLSEGSPLRGHIYSFHPYLSERREVANIDLVEDNLVDLTVKMKVREWNKLLDAFAQVHQDLRVPEYKVIKREVLTSQLPDNHPAMILKRKESVRVT